MRYSLAQFSPIFRIRDAAGRPYVLIGGQAVNYWAERYLPTEPELRQLLPFTSEDIDFHGRREDVQRIADQLNQKPAYPHRVVLTALAGAVPFSVGNVKSSVEIVRRVPGVSIAAIETLAIEAEWSGQRIRVLEPISLLAGKMELAFTLSQTERRDLEHVRILVPCVRGFLREFLSGVEAGELPAKGWLGAVNRLMKLAGSSRGRKVAKRLALDWRTAIPLPALARSTQPKIVAFREKQWARWQAA